MTTEDPLGDGDVVLRPLTEENRPALEALRVATAQRALVSSVTDSLAEAERYADANPLVFGLYDRETPVGFVMIAEEDDDPDYIAHFLWKLLIDERFQRRGFGTAALDLVAAYFRSKGVPTMWTSAGEGRGQPDPVLRAVRVRPRRRQRGRRRDPRDHASTRPRSGCERQLDGVARAPERRQ